VSRDPYAAIAPANLCIFIGDERYMPEYKGILAWDTIALAAWLSTTLLAVVTKLSDGAVKLYRFCSK